MGKNKRIKANKKNKIVKTSFYEIIPLLLILLIVPLIVHMKSIPVDAQIANIWVEGSINYDTFSYYKVVWFLLFTLFAIVVFMYKYYNNSLNIKYTKLYIPAAILVLFYIISFIFSEYKKISLFGFTDRYEGLLVLVSYILIMSFAINMVDTSQHIEKIIKALFISAFFISLVGLFQFMGYDFFKSELGKILVVPPQLRSTVDLGYEFGKYNIYSTLYHYNYVGSYMALLFPIGLVCTIFIKDRWKRVGSGALTILLFINLVACRSRAGIVGTAISTVLLLMILRKYILKYWKFSLGALSILIIIFVGLDAATSHSLINKFKSITTDPAVEINSGDFNDIEVTSNRVTIAIKDTRLNIDYKDGQIIFKDKNDSSLGVNSKKGKIIFEDPNYSSFNITVGKLKEKNIMLVKGQKQSISLGIATDGFKLVDAKYNFIDPAPVETFGFIGKEAWGSARGYIWSRSLPLLKKTIFKGFGPDTFAMYFPQYDYIGKLKAYGTTNMVIDKPHDMYLQTGINTGIISMIALIALFAGYIIMSLKIYWKAKMDNIYTIAGLGIFIGTIGYMAAGLFNDSVVSVAPVFWALMGIGISINLNLGKNSNA